MGRWFDRRRRFNSRRGFNRRRFDRFFSRRSFDRRSFHRRSFHRRFFNRRRFDRRRFDRRSFDRRRFHRRFFDRRSFHRRSFHRRFFNRRRFDRRSFNRRRFHRRVFFNWGSFHRRCFHRRSLHWRRLRRRRHFGKDRFFGEARGQFFLFDRDGQEILRRNRAALGPRIGGFRASTDRLGDLALLGGCRFPMTLRDSARGRARGCVARAAGVLGERRDRKHLAASTENGGARASNECKRDENEDEHAAKMGIGDWTVGSQQRRALNRLRRHEAPLPWRACSAGSR